MGRGGRSRTFVVLAVLAGCACFDDLRSFPAGYDVATIQKNISLDPGGAFRAATEARALILKRSRSDKQVVDLATADWLLAASAARLNRPQEGLRFAAEGLATGVVKLQPQSKLVGDLYRAQAWLFSYVGDAERALRGLQRAFAVYKAIDDKRSQALALQSMASLYVTASDYQHAIRYYEQAAGLHTADPMMAMVLYLNQGIALSEQGNLPAANKQLHEALALATRARALDLQARIWGSLAQVALKSGDLASAELAVTQSLRIAGDERGDAWRPELLGVAADLALRKGMVDRALVLIDQAIGDKEVSSIDLSRGPLLEVAYRVFKAAGREREALAYLEAYKASDDRDKALAASTRTALMSAQFDYANQRYSIAQLQAGEQHRDKLIAQARSRLLVSLLAASGAITVLLVIGFLSIRRSRDQVRAANDELSGTNRELERALAARTEFLATTSHEIRTPLNGILGMTQVLLADRALEANVRTRIELVQGAGETMKALVDDILDVAKMTTGELAVHKAEMDLHRLLRDAARVWESQAAAKGVGLAVDIDHAPDRVIEDEVRLRQIIFNLMANAIKFTDKGQVSLSVSVEAPDPEAGRPGERLRIAVADTGIGIPADRRDEVFESFRQIDGGTTRRHGGTGLGLAICRNLARAMGGDVTVTSVLGAGSTFLLDLPLERVSVVETGPRSLPSALHESRLLLVDVNPLNRSVLGALLGVQVAALEVAEGLATALEAIGRVPVDVVLADAVTLDRDMGAIAKLAAAAHAGAGRTVLLWPTPDAEVLATAADAGVERVIAKPIAAQDLVAALKALYGSAPAGIAA